MRILFVGDAYSVHNARWISQLENTRWDLRLFDPANGLVHEDLRGVHLYTGWKKPFVPSGTRVTYRWPFLWGRHSLERRFPRVWKRVLPEASQRLARLIARLRPDCVHALGLRPHAKVLVEAEALIGRVCHPWIYSCRGSDIYFFKDSPAELPEIRRVLASCDYYMCNCVRDVELARDYGFSGHFLGLFQGGGGYPIDSMRASCPPYTCSERQIIAVKGLQTQFGRADVAIDALRRCAHLLGGLQLVFYQTSPGTRDRVAQLRQETNVDASVMPRSAHREIWRLFGRARLSIGISQSDGIPNTMIESMIMGAFPIQTNPGGASAEWIDDGINGMLVPDDDSDAIAAAIAAALADDRRLDDAAERNLTLAKNRVDSEVVLPRVLEAYEQAVN